jgi:hypothetical protein
VWYSTSRSTLFMFTSSSVACQRWAGRDKGSTPMSRCVVYTLEIAVV